MKYLAIYVIINSLIAMYIRVFVIKYRVKKLSFSGKLVQWLKIMNFIPLWLFFIIKEKRM